MAARRSVGALCLGALALGLVLSCVPGDAAHATVVCQRGKKARLRAESCKKKETLVHDLGALDAEVSARNGRLDDHDQSVEGAGRAIGQASETLGIECAGDPSRTFLPAPPASGFVRRSPCEEVACRQHDGDEAACNSSYEYVGVAAGCVYLGGKCVPCHGCGEEAGLCSDPCDATPRSCAGDPGRTFAGQLCRRLGAVACANAWAPRYPDGGYSCFWNGVECKVCGEQEESDGSCTNACRTEPVTCADPGRSLGRCGDAVGAVACNATWEIAYDGPRSCWWDALSGDCQGCDTRSEVVGDCEQTCL